MSNMPAIIVTAFAAVVSIVCARRAARRVDELTRQFHETEIDR